MKPHIYNTLSKYLAVVFFAVALTACKKDLPPLPVIGTQGTFCWEQFQNNSFDPVSEWVDTDPNDFPECPNQNIDAIQKNNHRFSMQFARNNPNIMYYILKKCDDQECSQQSYQIAKYDFCTNQEKIILDDYEPLTGINKYSLLVGNEGEVLLPSTGSYNYKYTTNDMNTIVLDNGFNDALNWINFSIKPGQNKMIYNMMTTNNNKYIAVFDLINNTYDTIFHLEDYFNYQYYKNNQWILRKKDLSEGLYIYNPNNQSVTSVLGVQNESATDGSQKRLVYTNQTTYAYNSLFIKAIDNVSGSHQVLFEKDNYTDLLINNICLSPDEQHLVANITHQIWISNCDYEDRQYILVFNLQTGDWKAVDFAQ